MTKLMIVVALVEMLVTVMFAVNGDITLTMLGCTGMIINWVVIQELIK